MTKSATSSPPPPPHEAKFMPMFPIVGIGASAGGLEALEQFLSHLPVNCGIGFVIIQHLAPDRACILHELLQRVTLMEVVQARDAVQMKPDCVYVIPPNKDISISNRTLQLSKPVESHGLHLPIDSFLCSLAKDCGQQAIGVILSGMGSDGTLGLQAIREQGGFTLAQEPETAKFDSMPRSAIAAGLADCVAPPEELGVRIIEHLRSASVPSMTEQGLFDKDMSDFEKIAAILKARTKHDFSQYKTNSVYRRIERRMGIHKIDTLTGYVRFLEENRSEVDLLFNELLIGVTSFFRDPASWEELLTGLFPALLAACPDGGVLRAWSCGCSTGEEAYTLAILFREALQQVAHPEQYSLQIFATDIDPDAIVKARNGVYSGTISADISPERLQQFFVKEENRYRVRRDIREMVTFALQNVIMDPPFTRLDILICRNLLIYLTTDLQKKLMPIFHYSLRPGGLLFLGSAESIGPQSELFTPVTPRSKFFRSNESAVREESVLFPISPSFKKPSVLPRETVMLKALDNLQLLADRLVLHHFSTPAVLVNDQGDIVYFSGRTGKYLEPAAGKANMNIFAMIREGLHYELGSSFSKVQQQYTPVTARACLADTADKQFVDMTLLKIESPEPLRGMVMIAFKDVAPLPRTRRRKTGTTLESKRVEELEQELRATREGMQASQEEMKSLNEELQSTNEELQSTNEELTTSKEEMQSMNEELQTVNAEQSARLDDFVRISNDMENLLNSTEILTIFLDRQLQVRLFTTGVNRLFKLIPGDLGRPLTDIVSTLNYPQLFEHVQQVLKNLTSIENQVPTLDGRWLQVRIMPYRTKDKIIDGVVITCNDITTAKKVEDELRAEIARLKTELNA
jgi:two-component system, chemotaxis family, CheB/CheR fusion protein